MSVATARRTSQDKPVAAHPNELDLRRIQSALKGRERYRYVSPNVSAVRDGYLIRSDCCSRKIDPKGGEIDIALIRWDAAIGEWRLMAKDHKTDGWIEESRYARLPELLLRINNDPDKRFWQ
ncbi:DUF3024 domain-containing protein [Alteraurantiacibacter aquimixticola]|uniref:DUF3024 domain-containing protein n=1 Tax=Alteraurantiacibacter aquimixticola TaxID=2489173 RepID=A0A4T3F9C4_9SPHN|nr:DUF3024 domain-containing protein [Alteraurantiacibacter aquimixticola]TIX51620.1 DUF3024 domain-containing protein [Alteraurantiacibacter aquimixticola]